MKSFCIKNNNKEIINYLLDSFFNIDLDSVYISHRSFCNYENFIIHYTGNNLEEFYDCFCEVLCDCIIYFYEHTIIKRLIDFDYFYFSTL